MPPSPATPDDWKEIARLLFELGHSIRKGLQDQRKNGQVTQSAQVHKVTSADTIYEIDRVSEEVLVEWFENHWPAKYPADVIAEGLGDETGVRFPSDAPAARFTILIDPIDGTRGLMYDKRSAWMLAGASENYEGEERPTLDQLGAGAMVELPTSRQSISDGAYAWRTASGSFEQKAIRFESTTAPAVPLELGASTATDLRHGFASFASYFPEGREAIQQIEAAFLQKHLPELPSPSPLVFTDQYISSGGQLFELLAGRDRFVADLRPLIYERFGPAGSLTCHPYDLASLPVAYASGCVIETPWGTPLRAPLDTTSPVAWVGYANESLANALRPLLLETLKELGYPTPSAK